MKKQNVLKTGTIGIGGIKKNIEINLKRDQKDIGDAF